MSNKVNIYGKVVTVISVALSGILALCLITIFLFFDITPKTQTKKQTKTVQLDKLYEMNYDVSRLDNTPENQTIKYGYELFVNTPKYLGPNNGVSELAYAGNNLSCNNCHLYAGTKPYSGPLIGIIQRFPQFRGRENKMGTIEDRINGCFERSMNGRVLADDSNEMKAMVSYLDFLSRFAPEDGNIEGQGFATLELPERAVDLDHGKTVYATHCIACHGANGQGLKLPDSLVYVYPPLWGDDSFNDGAGMNRVITAAEFIKANMPFGATIAATVLTDEEAYDVAGYINSMDRPHMPSRENDFPDLLKKPVSTPYGPYADSFPIEQHKYGPFQPIMEYYKKKHNINKTK